MEENPSTNPNFTFCSSGQLCCQSQFYKHSATLIQHPATKAATLMLYLLYLFGSAYWISKLELGWLTLGIKNVPKSLPLIAVRP
jgi:hypothetical protein